MKKTKSKARGKPSAAPSPAPEPQIATAALDELPPPALAEPFNEVPLEAITESLTNPRRTFDDIQLLELADSIRRHGVLQPIILRVAAQAGRYEIVAGARRYLASRRAGRTTIPARVLVLSDREALEIQVVENLQRADLTPLEEADGYRTLHEQHGYTVEQLALRVSRSVGYIYARLKIAGLPDKVRELIAKGALDPAVAVLISRIPNPAQQVKAAEAVTREQVGFFRGPGGEERPKVRMTYREAQAHIRTHHMLRLGNAEFDPADAELVPAAGSCTTCPKRTGNQSDLFGGIADADHQLCTDAACFEKKAKAGAKKRLGEIRAAGGRVLRGEEARKERYDLVGADDKVRIGERIVTWRQALGKKALAAVPITAIETADAGIVEGYRKADLTRAARQEGVELGTKAPAKPKVAGPLNDREVLKRAGKEILAAVLARFRELPAAPKPASGADFELAATLLAITLENLLQHAEILNDLLLPQTAKKRRSWAPVDPKLARQAVESVDPYWRVAYVALGVVLPDADGEWLPSDGRGKLDPTLARLLDAMQVDHVAILRQTRAAMQAERKSAAARAKKAAAAKGRAAAAAEASGEPPPADLAEEEARKPRRSAKKPRRAPARAAVEPATAGAAVDTPEAAKPARGKRRRS